MSSYHKFFISIISLMSLFMNDVNAQSEFDTDSVYYTPIPKMAATKKKEINQAQDSGKKIRYFFNINSGALVGCQDCKSGSEVTISSSTIHGVIIGKKLRVGMGLGYDSYYLWQTAPLFGAVSWDLIGNKNKNALFIQVSYGGAFAWRNSIGEYGFEYGFKKAEGGKTFAAQIGYRVRYHDLKLSFSAGTKFQEVTTFYEYPTYYYTFNGQSVLGAPSTKSVLQELNRLQFNLSVGWK
jgi:hypothetical protein